LLFFFTYETTSLAFFFPLLWRFLCHTAWDVAKRGRIRCLSGGGVPPSAAVWPLRARLPFSHCLVGGRRVASKLSLAPTKTQSVRPPTTSPHPLSPFTPPMGAGQAILPYWTADVEFFSSLPQEFHSLGTLIFLNFSHAAAPKFRPPPPYPTPYLQRLPWRSRLA